MSENKLSKRELLREAKALFAGWELLANVSFLFIINFAFMYFVSKNLLFSMFIGLIGMTFFFFVYLVPNRKLKQYQFHLQELMKYVTNMTFFMQTGENVLYALKGTKNTVDQAIQKDIEKTIQGLEKDATLNTDHFRKYDFPTLDQYHQNLLIKYNDGGQIEDLFEQIQKDMLFELKKRDELYRKRKAFAINVYMLLGMVVGMMIILRLFVPFLWDMVLSFQVLSLGLLFVTYALVLWNLHMLQKHNKDISVRL